MEPESPAPIVAIVAYAAEATPAPSRMESTPEPRGIVAPRPIPELPPVALTLPPESGLELIETKFKAAPMDTPEPAQPGGARRVRPPKVQTAEEPLQMVETHKVSPPPA
jgi:hypothetical protein